MNENICFLSPSNQSNEQVAVKEKSQCVLVESVIGLILLTTLIIFEFNADIRTFFCGSLVIEFVLVFKNQHFHRTRVKGPPTGAWIVVLVPTIISSNDLGTAVYLIGGSLLCFIAHLFKCVQDFSTLIFMVIWVACAAVIKLSFSPKFIATCIFLFCLSAELLSGCANSLTLWETILIAQICFVFLISIPLFVIPLLLCYAIEHFKMNMNIQNIMTLCTTSFWLWLLLVDLVDQAHDDDASVYIQFQLISNPLPLIYDLIQPINILLVFALWAPLLTVAIFVVINFQNTKKAPFALRKLFHLLAGIVYLTGLVVSPHLLSIAAAFAFSAFYMIETFRRKGPVSISVLLNELLEPFRDFRDSGEIIFTPIALILGLSLPIWNFGRQFPTTLGASPQAWSGVISIALGDSVAALVGRRCGHWSPRWFGTHRTLIGSLASLLSQILLWSCLSWLYRWNWQCGLVPLSVGVLAEAYTEQIDNLVIPLLVMALLSGSLPS